MIIIKSFKNSISLSGPNRTSEHPSYLFSMVLVIKWTVKKRLIFILINNLRTFYDQALFFCLNIDCTLLVFQDNSPVSIVVKPDCFAEKLTLCTVCQRWALDKLPRDKAARNVFAHAGLVGVISCSGSVFLAWELLQLWHFQIGFSHLS